MKDKIITIHANRTRESELEYINFRLPALKAELKEETILGRIKTYKAFIDRLEKRKAELNG